MRKKLSLILFFLLLTPLLQISQSYASEDDLYDFLWLDPDKKVYVLQNKVYKKENKIYANIGFLYGLNSDYQDTTGFQFATGYYLHEEWALEFLYHQYSNSNNDAFKNLRQINKSVPFIRAVNKKYGAMLVYSPFYGKINTFNKVIYFDWSFGLGVGQISTESNARTVSNSLTADIYDDESNMVILAKTALRIHVTTSLHVDIDYFYDHYSAPGPTVHGVEGSDKWRVNSEVIFSIGFSF